MARYQSPLHIIDQAKIPHTGELSAENLKLARNILLAEFELKRSTTIAVNGKHLTRDDVIKMFDNLAGDQALAFHAAIAADRQLANFLEKSIWDENTRFADNPLYASLPFRQFIGPHFAEAFVGAFGTAFNGRKLPLARALFALPMLWDRASEQQAYNRIRQGILNIAGDIDRQASARTLQTKGLEDKFYHPHIIDILNLLPPFFHQTRYEYGYALVNLAAITFNKGKKDEAEYILNRIEFLQGGEMLTYSINDLRRQFNQISYSPPPARESSDSFPWYAIVIAIVLIIRVFACIGRQNDRKVEYQFEPYYNRNPQSNEPWYKKYKEYTFPEPVEIRPVEELPTVVAPPVLTPDKKTGFLDSLRYRREVIEKILEQIKRDSIPLTLPQTGEGSGGVSLDTIGQ